MADVTRSILFKGTPGAVQRNASLAAEGTPYSVRPEPLFKHIGAVRGAAAIAPGAQAIWHVVDFPQGIGEANLWDLCHKLTDSRSALAGDAVAFAEPDLAQQWRYDSDAGRVASLTSGCVQAPPKPGLPVGTDLLWYRDAQHANFAGAGSGSGVRIAHLDTGYDPAHDTKPKNLDTALELNLLEKGSNAADRPPGPGLKNFGHGTGTIGILAGAPAIDGGPAIGGAPDAFVVPVRVADGVVLFFNSTIAAAFDYVFGLCNDAATFVDVVTMSMGGLASQAWAEAVNALYDRGVFIVTAAGNNFANWPTRNIVYPARFRRVVAACGVMADGRPYADLPPTIMAGNYGPQSKMDDSALAAYTPNTPWAKFGCPSVVDRDGAGTSSATPQIAAAAALWIEKHRDALGALPEPWMRVEAIRAALFGGARSADRVHFGRGLLDVSNALAASPAGAASFHCEAPDDAAFPLFRVMTGLGLDRAADARTQMLELEALQLSQSFEVERVLPDPQAAQYDPAAVRRAAEIIASSPRASQALRKALAPLASSGRSYSTPSPGGAGSPPPSGGPPAGGASGTPPPAAPQPQAAPLSALEPPVSKPPFRPLLVYAFDPTLELELNKLSFNEAILQVRWEELEPGPVGDYLEVVDVDPASAACYAPIDLSNPYLLVENGRRPAEANPQFHQQMVYAVAMKTIEYFERALGRTALWAPFREEGRPDRFVQRLRIYPHALREANAYYSPPRKALLFGYFLASEQSTRQPAGTLVFTALSHDVIAHETTHALLDGLHRRYMEPSNPDVLAFHEGFADIVALFQHFAMPEALASELRASGADLNQSQLLGDIAKQFGEATYGRAALRQYIGRKATRSDYDNATEVHERGAVLVAAVFDAFLRIYRMRADRIIALASLGSGVLPPGQLPSIVADRLAEDTADLAAQWLTICIRALDYAPAIDITFGDYLRALITADRDVVPNDKLGYRTAFATAFQDRGIHAAGVQTISPSTLVWEGPELQLAGLPAFLKTLDFSWDLRSHRANAFEQQRANCAKLKTWLVSSAVSDPELRSLGLQRIAEPVPLTIAESPGKLHAPEVHSMRPARRVALDGQTISDLVVEITQSWYPDDGSAWNPPLRGGVTLLVELDSGRIRYTVRKRIADASHSAGQRAFAVAFADEGLDANYGSPFGNAGEPLAMVHRSANGYRAPEDAGGKGAQ
jgi:hypothetical protein